MIWLLSVGWFVCAWLVWAVGYRVYYLSEDQGILLGVCCLVAWPGILIGALIIWGIGSFFLGSMKLVDWVMEEG